MDGTIQGLLQNGKAHSNMKKVWAIMWMLGFWFLFVFLMLIIGIGFLDLIVGSGIIVIIFYYLIMPLILGFLVAYGWASLYWNNYKFDVGREKITITRGVIGKRIVNIPYERIQNVNIFRGVLERIFGLYSIQIETAGGFNIMATGGYGTRMASEGSIQGLINPEPIADYIIAKSKGKETLNDKPIDSTINNAEKIRLLEERLLKGEISEKTYEELKKKYGG
jgi:membrane protein YdbS with pleckstrin-like domain